jgi:MIF4G domain.
MWMYIITHEINMAWSQSYNMRNLLLQVRGILNKLTPEKFQKLSDDLLQTELNSGVILKGVILLVSRDSCSHLSVWCPIFTVVSV